MACLTWLVAVSVVAFAPIAVAIAIPTMIVFEASARSFPVAVVISTAFMARCYPPGSLIGRATPISVMPSILMSDRIPVTVYPVITGTWGYGSDANHARRRWRTNSYRNLADHASCGQQD
jgi:hypothetical protein